MAVLRVVSTRIQAAVARQHPRADARCVSLTPHFNEVSSRCRTNRFNSLSQIVSKTVETVQRSSAGHFLTQLKLGVNERRADRGFGVIFSTRLSRVLKLTNSKPYFVLVSSARNLDALKMQLPT